MMFPDTVEFIKRIVTFLSISLVVAVSGIAYYFGNEYAKETIRLREDVAKLKQELQVREKEVADLKIRLAREIDWRNKNFSR